MNETVMPLAEHMQIVVSDRHTFGTDAVVLADFARVFSGARVCDLGCGCGALGLLLLGSGATGSVCGIEIQPEAARQFISWC